MLLRLFISAALISCAFACTGKVIFQKVVGDFNYEEAKRECRVRGGSIAVLSTKSQIAEMKALVPSFGLFYFGATDLVNQGTWIWDDGTPMTFANWAEKQPDNFKGFDPLGEHCLIIGYGPKDADWDDISCMWSKYKHSNAEAAGVVCQF